MSSSSSIALAAVLFATALAACATDDAELIEPPPIDAKKCAESTLTYQNFAAPFVITWCRGCHGAALPVNMRQMAPLGVDFDTEAQVRAAQARLVARATGATPTMPPAGGPSAEERELLAEWLACGMK